MPRLRRTSPAQPGFTRRRRGRGWEYLDADGRTIRDVEVLQRLRQLAIPPAYRDVWICPWPNGHLQAVGTDDRGRRQYLYHPQWRAQRDRDKHDRVLTVAERLPQARERVAEHLALPGMPRERALATAFRLLDLGFFRVGGESYAQENGSFGLATIRREHVLVEGDRVVFEYLAKSGKERHVAVADAEVVDAVQTLRRRRTGPDDLLAWRDGGQWRDITSEDVNAYVKDVVGGEVSAKDFRTWHATVLAAVALAVSVPAVASATSRKRAVKRAMDEVAQYLGNTPTVARASYVDPRVVDLFEDGITVEDSLRLIGEGAPQGHPATHGAIERAVLDLLREEPEALRRRQRRADARRQPARLSA
jgi:DNA topoisomerase I